MSYLNQIYEDIKKEASQFSRIHIQELQLHKVLKQIYNCCYCKNNYTLSFTNYMSKNVKAQKDIHQLTSTECSEQLLLKEYPYLNAAEIGVLLKTKMYQLVLIIWLREFFKFFKIIFKTKMLLNTGPSYVDHNLNENDDFFKKIFSNDINDFLEGFTFLSSNAEFSYLVCMLNMHLGNKK